MWAPRRQGLVGRLGTNSPKGPCLSRGDERIHSRPRKHIRTLHRRRQMEKGGYVYIMTNKPFGVLYIGVTAHIGMRIAAHRNGRGSEFCRKWELTRLAYLERYDDIEEAIAREKAMKRWKRVWKLRLIAEHNPDWKDLFETITE